MSIANDNNIDQTDNEALFLWYAGKDISKWDLVIGTQVIEIEEGPGEIVGLRESEKYGVFFSVRFENTPEKEQDYAPLALEKGTVVFSVLGRKFEEMKLLMIDKFREYQEMLQEEAHQKEMEEKKKSDLLHYKGLCIKYHVSDFQTSTPADLLYVILLKLEEGVTLAQDELVYLEKQKIYFVIALHHERRTQQTSPDLWDFIKAASNFRKAGDPKRALEITEGIRSADPITHSAILVSRGGAFRDLGDLTQAEKCANEALNLNKDSYYTYNLLGAIAFQLGDLEKSEEYFNEAIRLGSKPQVIDANIRDALKHADPEEKIKAARYLLNKDPKRYSWASYYLKDENK